MVDELTGWSPKGDVYIRELSNNEYVNMGAVQKFDLSVDEEEHKVKMIYKATEIPNKEDI